MASDRRMGLLIDYEFCTGCHSCEVACKKELNLELSNYGIKVAQYGPEETAPDKWDYFFLPMPTDLCNLCKDRVSSGRLPSCVHHCQAKIMEYGPVEKLAKKMVAKPKMVLFAPV
jgi:Fe-S-cluster-containing dehydrogenase component